MVGNGFFASGETERRKLFVSFFRDDVVTRVSHCLDCRRPDPFFVFYFPNVARIHHLPLTPMRARV
jgi:hypothetical protein